MIAVRRLYLYLVAFVGLHVAAWGAAELGRALVDALYPLGAVGGAGLRRSVALNAAWLLVGVPVWLLHWGLAARTSRRDPRERAATLRRLYLYAVMAVAIVAIAASGQNALEAALRALLDESRGAVVNTGRQIASQLPWLVVGAILWLYHRGVAASDRVAVGEAGGGATLRRWYVYGVAFVALMYLLRDATRVARLAWETLASAATGTLVTATPFGFAGAAATTLLALPIWLTHRRLVAAGPPRDALEAQDVRSTLRPVYLFLALAVAVERTLEGAWQLLYYTLGRVLGVERPGGVGGNLLVAMGAPATLALVYGAAWLFQRHEIARQRAAQDALPGQVAVRRLYVYLVALLALAVLAAGAGGLLWTLADLATAAPRAVGSPDWWREQTSLYVSLLLVGLPVWARHWGPVAARHEEVGSLARRIYLYVALGAAVLALLGAGVAAARELLLLVLGESATAGAITNLARALAVAAVSGLVIFYHQRVLRRDVGQAQRRAAPPVPTNAPTPFGWRNRDAVSQPPLARS
ncbi:MAG TPA: DUF5671 domain-containing protein [Chloroflexota bacterium]|nr:DUF5671 domain-containing protein [Chloroflexota bacterium]